MRLLVLGDRYQVLGSNGMLTYSKSLGLTPST